VGGAVGEVVRAADDLTRPAAFGNGVEAREGEVVEDAEIGEVFTPDAGLHAEQASGCRRRPTVGRIERACRGERHIARPR